MDGSDRHPQPAAAQRRHVWVSGRVQGVGYRYSCVAEAAKHPIVGWVRNLPDGRVEAVFEGPPAAVAAMVEWCQKGPRYSHVTDVAVVTEQAEGFTRFSVRG